MNKESFNNKGIYDNKIIDKIESADKIIIGLSGGADSVVLTHIIYSNFPNKKIICAHVNHNLRGEEAKRDENFAREFSKKLNLEFILHSADINKIAITKKMGTEECARLVRYEFFESLCTENSVIATAHNANDNAETVVLNLIRGTGIKGLCGIPSVRGKIVRPILGMTRDEIEDYAKTYSLEFVTDSTNNEIDYSRNKIRNQVFPVLNQINPSFVKNILRTTDINSEIYDYIYSKANCLLDNSRNKYGLDVAALINEDDYIVSEVLKLFFIENGLRNFEKTHITLSVKAIKNGGAVNLPKDKIFTVKQGIACFSQNETNKNQEFILELNQTRQFFNKEITLLTQNNENVHKLLVNNFVDCDKIIGKLEVSSRKEGDYFYQNGRGIGKSLKKLFNEGKIPAHLREKVAVIRDENGIVFVEGFGVSKNHAATPQTKNKLGIEIIER